MLGFVGGELGSFATSQATVRARSDRSILHYAVLGIMQIMPSPILCRLELGEAGLMSLLLVGNRWP